MSRTGLRGLVFAVVLAFEVLGPFYRQVLHGRSPIFRNWVMYRGVGFGLVEVRFARRLPDGGEITIDRFAALGYADRRAVPEDVWRITGREGLERVTRRLCDRLERPAELRARARIATNEGWQELLRGDEPLCAGGAAS